MNDLDATANPPREMQCPRCLTMRRINASHWCSNSDDGAAMTIKVWLPPEPLPYEWPSAGGSDTIHGM